MSPFRKSDRPGGPYYVSPTLPGFGRVGPWSTGLRSKAQAVSVERWLREVALTDPVVVRGIVEGSYSLREAYVASKERRLDALKEQAKDPPLKDVLARYSATVRDRRQVDGLGILDELLPKGARFSWMLEPKHLSDLLHAAVARGLAVNTVYRSVYAAIKGILRYEVGEARKRAITADVVFRYEDDSRDVSVTPEQVRRLLDACDDLVRPVVQLAILTGVDRGPLIRLTPAHIDFEAGTLRVPDTKNAARLRTLELSAAALAVLRSQAAGKKENEPLFDLTYNMVDSRFRPAKKAAGLDHVRFKDLRHVFAGAWVASGGALKDLGGALGHTKASTSLRYTGRQKREIRSRMDMVAEHLGMEREHLRVEKGSA